MFNWLRKLFSRKKQNEEWANLHNQYQQPNGKNNLPLEPEKDPWRT